MLRLFRIISHNIRDAFRSIFRNFSLSLASVSCITITLIVMCLGLILSANFDNFTKLMKEDFTIVVFLDNKIRETEIKAVGQELKAINNIESYEFESKAKIAESLMATSDVFANIMKDWEETDNPLQDTFLVKVKEVEKIKATTAEIKKITGVSVVKYGEGVVEKLLAIFNNVEKGLFIIVISLVFVTIFLITNTIKLTIFSRKKEIEIRRLVGASNINIEFPFVIEGLFLGVLGALIPIIIAIYGYIAVYSNFDGRLFSPFVRLVSPEPFVYIISLVLLGIGIVVGMCGSLLAVRKYLKI